MSDSPHGNMGEFRDDVEDEEQDDDRDPTEKLIENVLDDAYVKESMAVLTDMLAMQVEIARKKAEQ